MQTSLRGHCLRRLPAGASAAIFLPLPALPAPCDAVGLARFLSPPPAAPVPDEGQEPEEDLTDRFTCLQAAQFSGTQFSVRQVGDMLQRRPTAFSVPPTCAEIDLPDLLDLKNEITMKADTTTLNNMTVQMRDRALTRGMAGQVDLRTMDRLIVMSMAKL